MNVQKSAPSPENAQGNSTPWFEKIDFWNLVRKSINLIRENKRTLIVVSLYILFTGGQAVTISNTMLQSPSTENEISKEAESLDKKNDTGFSEPKSWEETLKMIEQDEKIKSTLQEIVSNKETANVLIFFGITLLFLLILAFVATFLMNSHFHLLYFGTIFALENGQNAEREVIKEKIKGRWKSLSLMRLVFIFFYLTTAAIFFSPVIIFSSNSKIADSFIGFSSLITFATFVFISYVFRYGLLYFAEGSLGIRESIDRGYELLRSKWKETVLASLINFSAGIIFGIFFVFFLVAIGLVCGLIAVITKDWLNNSIILGSAIFLGLVVLLTCIFILIAFWQCFVLNFWSLFFREIAGKKIISPEEAILLEKKKKLAELAVKKETDENLKNI